MISSVLPDIRAYKVPRAPAPIDLKLDGNEGVSPPPSLLSRLTDPEVLRRYPNARPLEARLAERLGVEPEQVIVTAGGDDAIDRICRAVLCKGRSVAFPEPGFTMIPRYTALAGAELKRVAWPGGPFPVDAIPEADLIVATSPNNPTGAVVTAADLRTLSARFPDSLLLVDLAYAEFADVDLTEIALTLPNAVVIRTLSKAWGLAGLRVGYAVGPAEVIGWLRTAGAPYAVSSVSLALAEARLDDDGDTADYLRHVRTERESLRGLLDGAPSQANFVYASMGTPERALWLRDAMAGLGIGIRAFPGDAHVRVTCPGDPAVFARLRHALLTVLRPQALLFDMDGVLADVTGSYRVCIEQTAASYGVTVTQDDIAAVKAAGDANNDWIVTHRLIDEQAPLDDVIARFEARYAELRDTETVLLDPRALRTDLPIAVVTGRPRAQAKYFLDLHDLPCDALICMEDAPAKPDPTPVRMALEALGVQRAWMLGDTVDDVVAARRAGVLPIGVGGDHLCAAGAARIVDSIATLQELLP